MTTTLDKIQALMRYTTLSNKKLMAKELGISRPTFDARLSGERPWTSLETKWINHLYSQIMTDVEKDRRY